MILWIERSIQQLLHNYLDPIYLKGYVEGAVRGMQRATYNKDNEAMIMSLHKGSFQTAGAPKSPSFNTQLPEQALLSEN